MDDHDRVTRELRERLASSPFHRWLGVRVVEADVGAVDLELDADADHRNLQGLIHGGLLATLADVAMGLAVRTAVGPERRHITVEMGVRFLRPAQPGRITATGRTLRVGRQLAFAQAEVLDASGRAVATAQGTYSVGPIRE